MTGRKRSFSSVFTAVITSVRACKSKTLSAVVHRAKLGRSAESPGAFWVLMQSYLQFLKTALKKTKTLKQPGSSTTKQALQSV